MYKTLFLIVIIFLLMYFLHFIDADKEDTL